MGHEEISTTAEDHVPEGGVSLDAGFELRLLEERHAAELFTAVERNREHLRQWLPWVDVTRNQDDGLAFIRSSLEMFAANQGFAAGIWHNDGYLTPPSRDQSLPFCRRTRFFRDRCS